MQGWRAGTKWTRFTLARGDRETILTHMRCRRALGGRWTLEELWQDWAFPWLHNLLRTNFRG